MRDGNRILGVKRYRGEFPPNAGSFAAQIGAHRLNALVEREAAVIVYQHFGIWKAIGSHEKDSRSWQASRIPALDEHCHWAFRYLAERQDRGEIFITTTQRLLDFMRVRDGLRFSAASKRGHVHISAQSVECDVYGACPAMAKDLQGITFRVPGNPEQVSMIDGDGKQVPVTRHQSDDVTIVTVPWQRLQYPH
jgi:hypothetical protein